jgi:signal transduction histidine kinase
MGRKSLALRIISLSGAWIVMALVVTAILLVNIYRDHAARYYDEHVSMHLEELFEATELGADGTIALKYYPSDPRYNEFQSGWYWEIRQSGKTLKRSPSLGENKLNIGIVQPAGKVAIHEMMGPAGEMLRVHVIEVGQGPGLDPLVYLASSPMAGYTDDTTSYSNHVLGTFLLLGFGLLIAVVLQVRIALKPLKAISAGITDIREGRASKLPASSLEDVQPLVEELNNLIEHNAVLLRRARNRLGDLAHAVKNPLTVINNEAHRMEKGQKELIIRQINDISRNVDHYLSRARAHGAKKILGTRSRVKPVIEDLVYVMQRIYKDRKLEYDFSELKDYWFRGEGQDLEEMTGNLMDNASKWAKSRVLIHAEAANGRLLFMVEDDGPGIADSEIENVMRRGHKLDESKPGHGQGLGIVKDIAALYGGSLQLSRSSLGGVQARLDLPIA